MAGGSVLFWCFLSFWWLFWGCFVVFFLINSCWQILRIRQIKVRCCMAMLVALLCLQTSGKLQCHSKCILILLYSAHQERIPFENDYIMQLKI